MRFVPLHTFNVSQTIGTKQWYWKVDVNYTARRTINYDEFGDYFPSYFIVNSQLIGKVEIAKYKHDFFIQGFNLFNTVYPSVTKKMMPGRSFSIGCTIHLNSNNLTK